MKHRLSRKLLLGSLVSAGAVLLVCGLGILSLSRLASTTERAIARQVELINDASTFQALFFQKGASKLLLLTDDKVWLERLRKQRAQFNTWLEDARRDTDDATSEHLLARLEVEYAEYVANREAAMRRYEAGDREAARDLVAGKSLDQMESFLAIAHELADRARAQAATMSESAAADARQLSLLVAATAFLSVLGSLGIGFLLSRSIARPLQRLQLEVELAANRRRIQIRHGDDVGSLGEQVSELVAQLETALGAERQRALQHEKLSAVGALAAKLAHQLLNPVAGMKTSVQLLARDGASPEDVHDIARAVDRELVRVEHLVRRLLTFARPLAPRIEVCHVARLLELAEECARPELVRNQATIERAMPADLPPIEVDVELISQALANVLVNAAQAAPGRPIAVAVRVTTVDGYDRVVIEIGDQGPGIPRDKLGGIFEPFFTTKPTGHGLGLALTQQILVEHSGAIEATNREDGSGAVFTAWLPLIR
jgi:signal transduction histidine kinase